MTGRNKLTENPLIGILIIAATVFGIKMANAERTDNSLTDKPAVEFSEVKKATAKIEVTEVFNPNDYTLEDWKEIGFTEKQANTIIKYRDVVGGSFKSKEQLKKCYAISEEAFAQIEQYIELPEKFSRTEYTPRTYARTNKTLKITGRFNPDNLDAGDWQKMGFSEKQAAAIVKYRDYLGGSFISKEKFKECFIISPENYAKLNPYLMLPETSSEKPRTYRTFETKYESKSTKPQLQNFDPNDLDLEGWQTLGFSPKQAAVIVNYRNNVLKGRFSNLEQIQKCFVISAEKFEEIKPFIKFKETATTEENRLVSAEKSNREVIDVSATDLNEITFKQLTDFGFTEKAAASYLGFRKNLGGFVNKNQIFEVYGIDRETAEQLVAKAPLSSAKVKKYTLKEAPESWLKTHPYFRYSADKIIYYRVTYPDDKKIWKFLKTKPEYEAKMKMYLTD